MEISVKVYLLYFTLFIKIIKVLIIEYINYEILKFP